MKPDFKVRYFIIPDNRLDIGQICEDINRGVEARKIGFEDIISITSSIVWYKERINEST